MQAVHCACRVVHENGRGALAVADKSLPPPPPLPSCCVPTDMAVSSAGSAPPELLASTIGVLGRLRFGDELVLDSLARELMPSIKQLKADQLAEMVSCVLSERRVRGVGVCSGCIPLHPPASCLQHK